MMQNLRLAEKPPLTKPLPRNPLVDHEAVRAIYVFCRSWSRAVTPPTKKPTSARSLGRS